MTQMGGATMNRVMIKQTLFLFIVCNSFTILHAGEFSGIGLKLGVLDMISPTGSMLMLFWSSFLTTCERRGEIP